MEDALLLREYLATRSDRAFAALVSSQIDLAYSVARRRVRDSHLADDVTQAVFIIFAHKAPMLSPTTNLSGWIFRTTDYVARNALRAVARHRRLEREFAAVHANALIDSHPNQEHLAAIDTALAKLGKKDQEAVILKYYRGKSWREVGDAMGLTEDAARKRISRSLERLRDLLPENVVPVAMSALASSQTVTAAPAYLAAHVLEGTSAATATALANTSAISLIAATKLKIAAVVVAVLAVGVPTALAIIRATPAMPAAVIATAAVATSPGEKQPFKLGADTTRINAPLHPDGTVDYVAALNERYGKEVTRENNGFAEWLHVFGTQTIGAKDSVSLWAGCMGGLYLMPVRGKQQLVRLCGVEMSPANAEKWNNFERFVRAREKLRPTPGANRRTYQDADPDLAPFLENEEPFLAGTTTAVEKSKWWIPAVSADSWTLMAVSWPAMSWPNAGPLEGIAGDLCSRAMLRARGGDFDGFQRDILTVKRLARQIAGGPAMIHRMTGAAIDRLASQAIGTVAGSALLSEAQCQELAKSLDVLPPLPGMAEAIDVNERWMHLDIAAIVATGKSRQFEEMLDGQFGQVDRQAVEWDAVMRSLNATYDDAVNALRQEPPRQMHKAMQPLARRVGETRNRVAAAGLAKGDDLKLRAGEAHEQYSSRVTEAILSAWSSFPVISTIESRQRAAAMEDRLARVLIDVARYRAAKAKWPERLEDVGGNLLADVFALDDDSATPVRYLVNDATRACVYSVGANGVDDAGLNNPTVGTDDIVVGMR